MNGGITINKEKLILNLLLDIIGLASGSYTLHLIYATPNTWTSYAAIIFFATVAHMFLIRDNY